MQIIEADPARMIDLPGIGLCPRPVDIDQSVTGFKALKSLRIYRFSAGSVVHGNSEGDEVFIVPLNGEVTMEIIGAHPLTAILGQGAARALYMAPDHSYRLAPKTETLVAYARAAGNGSIPTHISPSGGAERLIYALTDLDPGLTLPNDQSKERLVHVVQGKVSLDGIVVIAPETVALPSGENATIRALTSALVLMITA